MNQIIKFRAWNGIKMVDYLSFFTAPEGWVWGNFNYSSGVKVVMQFTGLKDKNGKEIYEGDIVKVSLLGEDVLPEYKGRIFNWQANIELGNDETHHISNLDSKWLEVIGNVFENPELLKAE